MLAVLEQVEILRELAIVIDFDFCVDVKVELETFEAEDQVRRELLDGLYFLSSNLFVAFFAVVLVGPV